MSLRVVMIGLLLLTAVALGMIAYQVSGPRNVAPAQRDAPAAAPNLVSYLVAGRALSPGTMTKPDDFTIKSVPASQLPPDAVIDSPANRVELRGALIRRFLEPGTAIRASDMTHPRDRGFLAAVLPAGSRAVSIGVDAAAGVAGLIWPGDRVDLILTQDFAATAETKHRVVTSETVLTNVRLLAIDQDITQGVPATGGPGKLAATVTLEATHDQAEKIAVSKALGRLSLAVRSAADSTETAPPPTGGVSSADVSGAYSRISGATGTRIKVIEGAHTGEVEFK